MINFKCFIYLILNDNFKCCVKLRDKKRLNKQHFFLNIVFFFFNLLKGKKNRNLKPWFVMKLAVGRSLIHHVGNYNQLEVFCFI